MTLDEAVVKVRSKNAGPFWVTIDIFCGDTDVLSRVSTSFDNKRVAELLQQAPENIKRFELADLAVLKLSFPRPLVQGSALDRDMHGAQYALLLAEATL